MYSTLGASTPCKHKELKYFKKQDKVICLECGYSWQSEFSYPQLTNPVIPYTPPSPMPDYPVYPSITWCKVQDTQAG